MVWGALIGVVAIAAWWGYAKLRRPQLELDALVNAKPITEEVPPATVAKIKAFCGDCHGLPRPENYPRANWYGAVRRGFSYYAGSGRTDLDPPIPHDVEVYFRARAKPNPEFPEAVEATTPLRVTFTPQKLACAPQSTVPPAISCLRWESLEAGKKPVLIVADMREGSVLTITPSRAAGKIQPLGRAGQPCHVEPCDLDRDGRIDLVVADLGSTKAFDHANGRIIWMRRTEAGNFQQQVLLARLGRVADVRAADVDHDGDTDLIVAEFGARRTGNTLLLRNVAEKGESPRMAVETLDPRPGTIHIPLCDLNDDGEVDFISLVSQEYEAIDAFLGVGNGRFQRTPLWIGPDPAFGSSGIQVIDMDADGDVDVLLTNGDTFDDSFLKPSHGVQWLENRGPTNFVYHRIASLPGAYRALAGDVDNDGDVDVIAATWVSQHVKPIGMDPAKLKSIVCLEQVAPGKFAWHTLETGTPYHAVMEMADFDADGDLDFATGLNAVLDDQKLDNWLEIWWNDGAAPTGQSSGS